MEIKKLQRVEAPIGEYEDIIAFQLVEFTISFYGSIKKFILDTKILKTGEQLVTSGNGFIKDNFQII